MADENKLEKSESIKGKRVFYWRMVFSVLTAFILLAVIGSLLNKKSELQISALEKDRENSILQERVQEWRPLVQELRKIRTFGMSRIQGIKQTFDEISTYHDFLIYIAENPKAVADALNGLVAENYAEPGLTWTSTVLARKVRAEILGEGYSFKSCPDSICFGGDQELTSSYVELDEEMIVLGEMMRNELPKLLKDPQKLRGRMLLAIDPVVALMSSSDKARFLNFVRRVKLKYYDQAQDVDFQSNVSEYRQIANEKLEFGDDIAEDQIREQYALHNEKINKLSDLIMENWEMTVRDAELAHDCFSENPEEWTRIFDLLERKLVD